MQWIDTGWKDKDQEYRGTKHTAGQVPTLNREIEEDKGSCNMQMTVCFVCLRRSDEKQERCTPESQWEGMVSNEWVAKSGKCYRST